MPTEDDKQDRAVEDSFPASDPPARTGIVGPRVPRRRPASRHRNEESRPKDEAHPHDKEAHPHDKHESGV